jgi:hypothetical protein
MRFVIRSSSSEMAARIAGTSRILVMGVAAFIRYVLPVLPILLSACSTSAEDAAKRQTDEFVAAARDEVACRNAVAAKPRYQLLATHLPLATILDATLPQMTASSLANADDVATLELWLNDTRSCRKQLANEVIRVSPTSLGILATNWNNDDEAFVLLATRKAAWGKTIMKLRANRAVMLDGVSHEILQLVQQVNSEKQSELTRRVAIFSALTNLAP